MGKKGSFDVKSLEEHPAVIYLSSYQFVVAMDGCGVSMEDTRVKWWTLSVDEILVLVSCVLLLPYYKFVLRRSEVSELLVPKFKKSDGTTVNLSAAEARRMGIIINKVITTFSGDGTCLLRSLILHDLLSRRNAESVIRLGVLPQQTGFSAHAWVEVDGQPVNDTPDVAQRYLPFDDPNMSVEFKTP